MKRIFGSWNLYERLWLGIFCAIAIFITIQSGDSPFGFSVFLSGVLCVILVAKGNILNYTVGMYNTLGYAFIAYQNGLFGEMGLNLFFYVPMNVLGFFLWRRHIDQNEQVQMRRMSGTRTALTAVICVVGIAAMGFGLSFLTGQNTPYIDATTNVLSIAATILMVRRYREQWLAYMVLNLFTVLMWVLRTMNGSPEGVMMIVMWSAYFINAAYGWMLWTKGARKNEVAA